MFKKLMMIALLNLLTMNCYGSDHGHPKSGVLSDSVRDEHHQGLSYDKILDNQLEEGVLKIQDNRREVLACLRRMHKLIEEFEEECKK